MIDLTARPELVTTFTENDLTGETTISFRNSSELTLLGEIKIETTKLRALVEALGLCAREYYPVLTPGLAGQRTVIDKNARKSSTVFG